MSDTNLYQTYLKDCDCKSEGIIIYEGKAVCRWCRKPYAKAGCMNYLPEHFQQSQDKQIGWEIVEFKTKDGHLAIKQSEPRFGLHWRVMKGESIGWCSYSTCIEDYNIHSVKRLSDGEVFTIGEKVEYTKPNPDTKYNIIEKFTIHNAEIYINEHYVGRPDRLIDTWKKYSEPPQPSSIDRIEVLKIGNRVDITTPEWPKAYYLQFCTSKEVHSDKFHAIKQAIEDALNESDTINIDWAAPPITEKYYTQSEVDTIREETWKAARETTFSFKGEQDFPNPKIKYPALQDYLNSLSKETKPKEEGKPVEGYLNTVEAYSEGFTHGVRHCQKYGIPL